MPAAMARILAAGIVLLSLFAVSGGAAGGGRLSGAGALSCRNLTTLAASRTPKGRDAVQWSLGYLTGRAESGAGGDHRAFHGPDGIVIDLVGYCRRHPDAQVADAAVSFFRRPARP
ncbi:hypothetical protein [Bosea sp. (in: a-proteobacteria)]|uniref:hypothetical protein n=1 Tax=Bosea sp. (in: a-proteobacteria) TaxID=1871050 RepID=UPI0025BC40D4|nr:hypothetical protein [Bosea sp. (in: a-proteobacteria)]